MLQGIRSLIQESIKKGDLKEIKTDSAVLLINNCDGTQITMILAASNDSILLRNALISFSIEFCEKYAKFINSFGDVSEFRSAKEIVEKRFLFVPD